MGKHGQEKKAKQATEKLARDAFLDAISVIDSMMRPGETRVLKITQGKPSPVIGGGGKSNTRILIINKPVMCMEIGLQVGGIIQPKQGKVTG